MPSQTTAIEVTLLYRAGITWEITVLELGERFATIGTT